tara:strand:- start:2387 stop:3010 length:624 start_codon:yes stop_codon:yes gene_type:complete
MGGFRPYQAPSGAIESKAFAPLGPSQSFDSYDPVYLLANQLTVTPKDGSVALVAELVGFAATPATGSLAGSRTAGTGTLEQASPGNFGDVGATENVVREYIRPTQGQLMATHNFWTNAAGTAQDVIGGADLGVLYQITSAAAGDWGLVDAAATVATQVSARVVQIIGTDGNPFNADTTDTTCTGDTSGPLVVFEIANLHELTQVTGG